MAKSQAERSRDCQRRRREKAKATGLCIICCKALARPGMASCQVCSDRINKRAKMRRATV